MKRWFWLSIVIVFSCHSLNSAGNIVLAIKADAHQRGGVYKEFYNAGGFAVGGVVSYEFQQFYRSVFLVEFDFNFEKCSTDLSVEHIAGTYSYKRSLSRNGFALRLRYEHNFSRDGISFAAGLQRDFEKETLDGQQNKSAFWRPTVSTLYGLNLGRNGRQRVFVGFEVKLNVDGGIEASLVTGIRTSLKLFHKYED